MIDEAKYNTRNAQRPISAIWIRGDVKELESLYAGDPVGEATVTDL